MGEKGSTALRKMTFQQEMSNIGSLFFKRKDQFIQLVQQQALQKLTHGLT